MDELDPQTRGLLDAARPGFSPSAQELTALAQRLDVPPPSGGPAVQAASASKGATLALVVAAVAILGGVVAAVVLKAPPSVVGVADGDRTRIETREAAKPSVSPSVASSGAVSREDASPTEVRPRAPIVRPTPAAPTASPTTPRRRRGKVSPARGVRRSGTEPDDAGGASLAAEVALLVRTRRAARAERWSDVRTLHREHQARFPQGALSEESSVLDLVAACSLGKADATAQAQAYLDGSPRFAARVKAGCMGDSVP